MMSARETTADTVIGVRGGTKNGDKEARSLTLCQGMLESTRTDAGSAFALVAGRTHGARKGRVHWRGRSLTVAREQAGKSTEASKRSKKRKD